MAENMNWKIVAFENKLGVPRSVYISNRQKSMQFGALGEALSHISSELYERALRAHLIKQFEDSAFQASVKKRLDERSGLGVLIVVGYHVTMSSGGPRYQNVRVTLGPSAPSAFVAIQWNDAQGYIVPDLSPARYKQEYMWLEPTGLDMNRVFRHQLPKDICGFSEYMFNELMP
ncbi:hypothetical protein [Labrenzia sp. 011]|uniref:hypothetical protein n=1 Tax=Labrenzia sp. 011 TaxID=2171494 RepID=UPI000D50B631|nr:hypothetical protein [Labrenzia sp. 011]PVB63319.1 hypothetical protein DCO57_00410 [Labrenzia sp. 011]